MGVNKVVAKFCAIPTPFRDHHFGENQLTRGLSFLQSARTGRECDKPGPCEEANMEPERPNWIQNGANNNILKLPKDSSLEVGLVGVTSASTVFYNKKA